MQIEIYQPLSVGYKVRVLKNLVCDSCFREICDCISKTMVKIDKPIPEPPEDWKA